VIREAGLNVDLLVNNAGFGLTGDFSSQALDRQLEMIQVNVVSLVTLTRLCLPLMIARHTGAIINVASTAAFQGVPWLSLYAGTKALVLNFSEGLAAECARSGVRVMAFCPGPTESNFHQTAGALPRGGERTMLPAADVVNHALHQLEQGAVVAIPGLRNRLTVFSERFVPRRLVARLAAKVYGPE
jgi:short-subunit dehydrogenase